MELWDLYDKDKQVTGKQHIRGVPVPDGFFHLAVIIFTVNNKNQILITKRAECKHYGGLWECSGGSVIAGESSFDGAKRELFEETGIDVKDHLLQYADTYYDNKQTIFDVYIDYSEAVITDLVMQEDETVEARWVTLEEFDCMGQEGLIIPSLCKWKNDHLKQIEFRMQPDCIKDFDDENRK